MTEQTTQVDVIDGAYVNFVSNLNTDRDKASHGTFQKKLVYLMTKLKRFIKIGWLRRLSIALCRICFEQGGISLELMRTKALLYRLKWHGLSWLIAYTKH